MITLVLSNIFFSTNNDIAIAAVALNGVLMFFEVVKIAAYCLYDPSRCG